MNTEKKRRKNASFRHRCRALQTAVFLFAVFCGFGLENLLAQDFQTIADGIEHAKYVRQMKSADGKSENVVFNLLRLDLTKVRLDVVHAFDAAIGMEKASSIAVRHGAIAAINAGFFRLDKSIFAGDAAGILQVDGKLLSESYANRIALLIANKANQTEVSINHLNVSGSLNINNQSFSLSGINRQRTAKDETIVFTPEFNRTTLTDSDGLEIIVQKGKITQIFDGSGSNFIPADGFVISASGKKRQEILRFAKIGAKAKYQFSNIDIGTGLTTNPVKQLAPFSTSEDIIGGVPELIRNGKIAIDYEAEKTGKSFVETHHPRTAVAKLKDGRFLMITVDGRSEESGGISLPDLAAFMLELGAADAMNLDGGGSTTMFLNGKVVNRPSDKEGERAVSDAILVFPRKK